MGANAMKYVPATLSYPTSADGEYLTEFCEPQACTCALHVKLMEHQRETKHAEFQRQFHGGAPRHPRAG